ncbi:MAG: hypothetical protein M1544_02810 [Candidatus Marsarchaeota archaeon]|nr:hypothetical protein [Candidatus Marsarchaeota archaeon]
MGKKANGFAYAATGAKYALIFMSIYFIVAIFEGSCANPNLNNSFLLATAPFNPLENCLLAASQGGIFIGIVSNFLVVALLIWGAGYYFGYLKKVTNGAIRMEYVFLSAVISTYMASIMSYLYFSKFVDIKLKVATGTSIIGFDMCLFVAVFMFLEIYYYTKARALDQPKMRGSLKRMAYLMNIRLGFLAIALILIYSYLNISLVHLAGLIGLPIFAIVTISLGHKSMAKLLSQLRKPYGLK